MNTNNNESKNLSSDPTLQKGNSCEGPFSNPNTETIGEQRVRTSFNVGDNTDVDKIKKACAELINLCESLKDKDPRLCAIAQTKLEESAMWAVKLATA